MRYTKYNNAKIALRRGKLTHSAYPIGWYITDEAAKDIIWREAGARNIRAVYGSCEIITPKDEPYFVDEHGSIVKNFEQQYVKL